MHVGQNKDGGASMEDWMKWFEAHKENVVDMGAPIMNSALFDGGEKKDIESDQDELTGYMILKADSMEDAIDLVKSAPGLKKVRIYEVMDMSNMNM
ncbi:MAG: hypothetical protein Q9M91_04350 [Candidatus Dojkabacteria bacterium]|nr:hypothetical protein [Candidatus Dojkabacteria bacterium]MDQ7021043.1 hypothetical protein [Candidatus Dojkabacteria bacterium]